MYFSRNRLCLFILVIAQLGSVLTENNKYGVQIVLEESAAEQESLELHQDHKKNNEDIKSVNATSTNNTVFNCLTDKVYGPVELVNSTRLLELLIRDSIASNRSRNDKDSKQLPGACVLVLFYARWCIFSSQAAPHFNALPRFFPHIKTAAINVIRYPSLNAHYGIVGVPTLILIHNGIPVVMFNGTVYTLEYFAAFITLFTNLQTNGYLYLTPADFVGPVPSTPSTETDYCLVLSWIFIAVCALYFTSQSRWWQQFVELIQNTWRESNAQHEHVD